jgi:Zinc dependent phospholipase C/Domain of unknown function (DUF4332)
MLSHPPALHQAERRGPLERIIWRTYTHTVHQAVASEALLRLSNADAANWRCLFSAEAKWLALGAVVPDTEFRDFKNHVLFPRDGYWGGAIARAQSWYQNLAAALANKEWSNAAYSAGVLAHYVVDALHPFHTAQSEAENDVHFACDAAAEITFAQLQRNAMTRAPRAPIELGKDGAFLASALACGADAANVRYESLLNHCSLARAAADPASALDPLGRDIMAAVLDAQIQLLAAIFERAITDAGVTPPRVSLGRATSRALWDWPLAFVTRRRRLSLARQRLAAMADELHDTGRVAASLPEEERAKRDLYAKEIVAKRPPLVVDNVFPFQARRPAVPATGSSTASPLRPVTQNASPDRVPDDEESAEIIVLARHRATVDAPRPAPRYVKADPVRRRADIERAATADAPAADAVLPAPQPAGRTAPVGIGHAAAAMLLPASPGGISNFRDRRPVAAAHTTADDLDIPGLRPVELRTLRAAGITSKNGFLEADMVELSARSAPMMVSAATLRLWQARVRLMQTVPNLTLAEADLLAGSGYADAAGIATADAEKVCADILAYVGTADGKAALAAAAPPDIAKIRAVIEAARATQAA